MVEISERTNYSPLPLRNSSLPKKELIPFKPQKISKNEIEIFPFGDEIKFIVRQNKSLSYEEIDQCCKKATGKSFFEYCNENKMFQELFKDEADFKRGFNKYVSMWIIGNYAKAYTLYNAFAEESSFEKMQDGSLVMRPFVGMNVPHAVVLRMFNELFKGVSFDKEGNPHGIAVLKIDAGSEHNIISVTIDFDKKTISPPIKIKKLLVKDGESAAENVSFNNFMSFIRCYLDKDKNGEALFIKDRNGTFVVNPRRGSEDNMNIFLHLEMDLPIIRHEFMHALYDNNHEYKARIIALARNTTLEQREAAVLATAWGYDPLDPDARSITPDLVIDEMYNGNADQGVYDPLKMQSKIPKSLNAQSFCEKYKLTLSLAKYKSIDQLPISEKEKAKIRNYQNRNFPNLSEADFLRLHSRTALEYITSFSFLRRMLIEQQPQFHQKIVEARKQMIDRLVDKKT